jgi:hypothetical protein
MILQTWGEVLRQSFMSLGVGLIGFLPNVIIAVVIFIAGWVVGSILCRIIAQVFAALKVDNMLRTTGLEDVVHRAGFKLNSGLFVGMLVEWFVVVAFLIAAFNVLGLNQVNVFLQQVVLYYIPQVIVAVLILLVAGIVAEVSQNIVAGSARAAGLASANFLGTVTRWAIWIFAILTALYQLGIAAAFVQTLFTGIVVAISIALGLSFGLGGQEAAGRVVDEVRRKVTEK